MRRQASAVPEAAPPGLLRRSSNDKQVAPSALLPFASVDGPYPALPSLVENYQRKHRFAASVAWFKRNRGFYTEALPFPATVKEERTCGSSSCCRGLYEFFPGSVGKLKAAVVHILDYIRVVLQHASNRKINDSAGVHNKKGRCE